MFTKLSWFLPRLTYRTDTQSEYSPSQQSWLHFCLFSFHWNVTWLWAIGRDCKHVHLNTCREFIYFNIYIYYIVAKITSFHAKHLFRKSTLMSLLKLPFQISLLSSRIWVPSLFSVGHQQLPPIPQQRERENLEKLLQMKYRKMLWIISAAIPCERQ